MKKFLKITTGFLAAAATSFCFANTMNQNISAPHIWHTINAANGSWQTQLQLINEVDKAWFVLPDGTTKVSSFQVSSTEPKKVGLVVDFSQKPDFNLAYTITLVKNGTNKMSSKSCIFIVTATGPGKPDISTHAYNGAACSWKAADHAEDFYAG